MTVMTYGTFSVENLRARDIVKPSVEEIDNLLVRLRAPFKPDTTLPSVSAGYLAESLLIFVVTIIVALLSRTGSVAIEPRAVGIGFACSLSLLAHAIYMRYRERIED